MAKPKIRILQAYRHPRSKAIIVEYEFDYGLSGTLVFNALLGKDEVLRRIKSYYRRRKVELADISGLEGLELEEV